MALRFHWTAERVFLICGLLFITLGWFADLIGILLGQVEGGHGAGDTITRMWFTMFGLFFAAGGAVYDNYEKFLNNPRFTTRYLLANLLLLDGGIHLYALTDHLSEALFEQVFFGLVAPAQIALGLLMRRADERWDRWAFGLTIFLILAWVLTRTMVVWPLQGIEAVGSLDVVSKLVEIFTVGLFISLWRESRATQKARLRKRAPQPASR